MIDGRPPAPPPLTAAFARHLHLTKGELLDDAPAGLVPQTGAAQLDQPLPMPRLDQLGIGPRRPGDEPAIETIVADLDGRCTPTGGDPDLAAAWLPTVEAMVGRVLDALGPLGLQDGGSARVVGPLYVTTSLTPIGAVTVDPHLDDDRFVPTDGVGIVAIVASHAGPRVATEPVAHRPTGPSLPLEIEPGELRRFTAGQLAVQQAAAERIVVFPQFGQLHAGPLLDLRSEVVDRSGPVRHLAVLRATTAVDNPA